MRFTYWLIVVTMLFGGASGLRVAIGNAGCNADPDGKPRCAPETVAPTTDEGCNADPDGKPRCVPGG